MGQTLPPSQYRGLFARDLSFLYKSMLCGCMRRIDRLFLHKDAQYEASHSPCLCLGYWLSFVLLHENQYLQYTPQQVLSCTMSLAIMFPQPSKERTFQYGRIYRWVAGGH